MRLEMLGHDVRRHDRNAQPAGGETHGGLDLRGR